MCYNIHCLRGHLNEAKLRPCDDESVYTENRKFNINLWCWKLPSLSSFCSHCKIWEKRFLSRHIARLYHPHGVTLHCFFLLAKLELQFIIMYMTLMSITYKNAIMHIICFPLCCFYGMRHLIIEIRLLLAFR